MKIEMEVPRYSAETGIRFHWDDSFLICVSSIQSETRILANSAGLRSLARILLTLADEAVPAGRHVHLDSSNSLEDGSTSLVIERSEG
jgi:hypothetical protein